MRYGIYGGGFDPVHLGHLLVAESCLRGVGLDRVIFVPTGISPHKNAKNSYAATAIDRYNMLLLALDGYEEFEVSRFEIDRNTISYTIDTLRYFHNKLNNVAKNTNQNYRNNNSHTNPAVNSNVNSNVSSGVKIGVDSVVEIFLIMGCDMFCDLPNWREVDEILKLAAPIVVLRNGSNLPETNINYITVNMPIIDLASSKIRNMIENNIPPRFQITKETLNYIKKNNLYKKNEVEDSFLFNRREHRVHREENF
ncbi:MAG: nicotinate (nicotinamide) nucleotide adenylyltransferase [Planctomycetaceae bacterium]|jgi:nicotinate-nucleotide adenylyltransferase|nr:nicotinate (nicotinamide) nucleotide adenylyltransferase [Planctomycetaceae bacterium]